MLVLQSTFLVFVLKLSNGQIPTTDATFGAGMGMGNPFGSQMIGAGGAGGNAGPFGAQIPGAGGIGGFSATANFPGGFASMFPNGGQRGGAGSVMPSFGQQANTGAQCTKVDTVCSQYGFNSTMFPNYIGHVDANSANTILKMIFDQTKFCVISREKAEIIGCAILIPVCMNNKKIPPCKEDCLEVITKCKINTISGFQMAHMICSIFPTQMSGQMCISR